MFEERKKPHLPLNNLANTRRHILLRKLCPLYIIMLLFLYRHTPFFIAMKYHNHACASLLNPLSAEPLVWPSPWKFMSDLDPEAKTLLEAALAQANDAWERRIFASQNEAAINKSSKQAMRVSEKQEVKKIPTHHTYFCYIYIYLSLHVSVSMYVCNLLGQIF